MFTPEQASPADPCTEATRMHTPHDLEERLSAREETIKMLTFCSKWVPPVLTAVLVISVAMTVFSIARSALDEGALVVGIVVLPMVVLAWVVRELTYDLIGAVDLRCIDPEHQNYRDEAPTPRR